jgi:hypothetical protein
MSKKYIINRLKWYYPLERFNAFFFTGVLFYVLYKYVFLDTIFLNYGLLIVISILFQGQHYWKLKLWRLTQKEFSQKNNIQLFNKFRKINVVLIYSIPIVFLLQLLLNNWTIKPENFLGWAISANILGILEHINYYNRQLMIDNIYDLKYLIRNKKLKIASLKKDLDENEI